MIRPALVALGVGLLAIFAVDRTYAAEPMAADEAGLWMLVEDIEQEIRTSSRVIEDPALHAHVRTITCELTSTCDELRIYLLRAPGFNAFMMPNGAMVLQSGLLLRVRDDAELGAVIGHEIAHFSERHSIARHRRWKRTTGGFAVATAMVGAVGAVAANSGATGTAVMSDTANVMLHTAGIAAQFQLVAHDRSEESAADRLGVAMLSTAGYDPVGSTRVWKRLIVEQEAGGNDAGFSLLATHPAPRARIEDLSETIETLGATETGRAPENIVEFVAPYRMDWLADEAEVQHPGQFAHVAEQQIEYGLPSGVVRYMAARSWQRFATRPNARPRERLDALENASRAFAHAARTDETNLPAAAYREWGKVEAELGRGASAHRHFQRYLEIAPRSWDARFVRREMERLDVPADS